MRYDKNGKPLKEEELKEKSKKPVKVEIKRKQIRKDK